MPFLGNFCPFPQKAPTVVLVLLSHEAHYGGTQKTLMGPESLTPNWGRNCIDGALFSSTRQNGYCMLSDKLFFFFFSTESNLITFSDPSSKVLRVALFFVRVPSLFLFFFPVSKDGTEDGRTRRQTANQGG